MDQAATGTRAANVAQPVNETNSLLLTPLGEPMDQYSISYFALYPVRWHLHYWLAIATLAVMRGEDILLTHLLIHREINKLPDAKIIDGFRARWRDYRHRKGDQCQRYFSATPESTDEVARYLRDVDRMLAHKRQKAREFLESAERDMFRLIGEREFRLARLYSVGLKKAYQNLAEDETRDARATDQLQESADEAQSRSSEHLEVPDLEDDIGEEISDDD